MSPTNRLSQKKPPRASAKRPLIAAAPAKPAKGSSLAMGHVGLAAVGAAYQAALDPSLWPTALEVIAAFVGAAGGLLLWLNERLEVRGSVHVGIPTQLVDDYRSHKLRDCPRLAHALARPEGTLLYDYQHIREDEMDASPYYNWLEQTGSGARYYLGCRLSAQAGLEAFLLLTFGRSEGHPQKGHMDRFNALIPHLRQAIDVRQRLHDRETRAEACLQLLSRLNLPVALLDDHARIVCSSAAFERATSTCGDCVTVQDGAVKAGPGLSLGFECLLRKACNGCAGATPTAALKVPRESGTCSVTLLPFPVSGEASAARSHFALFLSGSCRAEAVNATSLQARFSFTGAELRLAIALLAGQSLEAASRSLGVSVLTARSHLQAIFRKTDMHRQADLVRVLLSVPF